MRVWPAWIFLSICTMTAWSQSHEIIFLVDQSGSMSRPHGPNNGWEQNDKDNNRLEAIFQGYEAIQKYLDDHRLTNVAHRVHVVEFGTSAIERPDLATSIQYNPSGPSAYQPNKDKLKRLLVSRDLGVTDTLAGFANVKKIISKFMNASPDHVHVIAITDGKPYVEGSDTGIGSAYQQSMDLLIRSLRKQATLDVIGVIGAAGHEAYWPTWGPYWERVSDKRAYGEPTGRDISKRIQDIIRERLGLPPLATVTNPYYCPPYLRSITFTVFKKQRGGRAQIKDANGRLIQLGQPGVEVINEVTYDRITVADPPPGFWELDSQAAKITVEFLYKQVVRMEPKASQNVLVPMRFGYQVLSDQNLPFRPLPQYPVSVSVELTDSKSAKTVVPLTFMPEGLFCSTSPFQFAAPGAARLRMAGTAMLPDNSVATVFESDEMLNVTDKTLLVLNAGSRLPGSARLIFGRNTLIPEISMQRYRDGAPVPLGSITAQPNDLFEFRMVRPDDQPLVDWRKMSPTNAAAVSVEMPTRVQLFSLPWLRRHAESFAQVRVNESVLHPDYQVRELKRNDPDPPTFDKNAAVPALVNNPLAVPVVLGEWLPTFVLILMLATLVVLVLSYVGYRYLRKLGYWIGDTFLFHQRVLLVLKPPFATEEEEIKKNLSNDYLIKLKGIRKVQIRIGEPDNPTWQPRWLRTKRLFLPWEGRGVVVRMRYPASDGKGRKIWLREGDQAIPLDGLDHARVDVQVRVTRRGKEATVGF